MSSKAPSEGTKVTPGQNAPITSEGPGFIDQHSLAAESQSFRQANEVAPQNQQHTENPLHNSIPKPHEGGIHQTASGFLNKTSGPGTAPSYVQSQYIKGQGGPHGKNVTEDESIATEDREKNASFSQFGTKADPGREAERKFMFGQAANPGATAGRGEGGDREQPFGVLGSSEEA
ncbi:uncharacterized protein GGS22DRAFT_19748 [Annulohypoxylon maeteangense]|uniref:uncharacterized protein n=1 Tax=Annulohypoxylon maeteangense TaxID=1927788 RepID=UPI0020071E99|nr:uncharacterized protein GGS22DRAFT_19748 [Annulohypoxylon maeteangense]KAI0884152.1 hypothetical protein GGS22DRAFT_19748 [Annulohypoxylon maeteangense]